VAQPGGLNVGLSHASSLSTDLPTFIDAPAAYGRGLTSG